MHFNEADTELLGGSVFKCGKYVGWSIFGTKTLLGPVKGTENCGACPQRINVCTVLLQLNLILQ